MFSHETARGTVGLTPNKYTYIFTCTLYSVLFELVPTSAENIQFKSFRGSFHKAFSDKFYPKFELRTNFSIRYVSSLRCPNFSPNKGHNL